MAIACPSDAEIERPRKYVEMVCGHETWCQYGIRITRTDPEILSSTCVETGVPLPLRVYVEVRRDPQKAPQCLFVSCWTHMRTGENPCGIWKEIYLPFNPSRSSDVDSDDEVMTFVYQTFLVPDFSGYYRLTFLIKWNHLLIWANEFQHDCFIDVS